MDPAKAVIWMFLAIFLATALIALGSLVERIPLAPYYKKNLFRLLILEVVGCVISFGVQAFDSTKSPRSNLRATLLSSNLGWDWQYAEKHWRARFQFQRAAGDKLVMAGDTFLVDANGQQQDIIKWESSEPFVVPTKPETFTFRAHRTWTEAAAKAYAGMPWEVGKKTEISITLAPEIVLRGAITNVGSAETWGVVFTPAYP